jgi:hypothetical protein
VGVASASSSGKASRGRGEVSQGVKRQEDETAKKA